MNRRKYIFILAISLAVATPASFIFAEDVDELREQIESHASHIGALEEEIAEYEKELEEVSEKKDTLENAVYTLDISRRKVNTNISATRNKIDATTLQIHELADEIEIKETEIETNSAALAQIIRRVQEAESATLIESILSEGGMTDFLDDIDEIQQIRGAVQGRLDGLVEQKLEFEEVLESSEKKKGELSAYQGDLTSQKRSLDLTRREKNSILEVTKGEEANYQKLLDEKRAAKKLFEQEINEFESRLKFILDPTSIPSAGDKVLAWPLDHIYVTQQFGYTEAGKRLYKKGWHNGVDFRARTPVRVRSAASGIVVGTGNTDLTCRNASFGKWVLVRHYNGLSSLYAHLSSIEVSQGQKVVVGEVVGFSGNTGYSTAAHLHMGVYASDGVEVRQLPSSACKGKTYTLPLAAANAYLNPLDYLPSL